MTTDIRKIQSKTTQNSLKHLLTSLEHLFNS